MEGALRRGRSCRAWGDGRPLRPLHTMGPLYAFAGHGQGNARLEKLTSYPLSSPWRLIRGVPFLRSEMFPLEERAMPRRRSLCFSPFPSPLENPAQSAARPGFTAQQRDKSPHNLAFGVSPLIISWSCGVMAVQPTPYRDIVSPEEIISVVIFAFGRTLKKNLLLLLLISLCYAKNS